MRKLYQNYVVKARKALLLTLLFGLFTAVGFSQTDKFWSANTESRSSITTDKAVKRLAFPKEFKLFNLNIEPLRTELFTVTDNRIKHSTIISLPNADGQMEKFEVYEASNFEPALQAKYPEIRAFSGRGITDRYATLKLSISPQGIQTMIFRTGNANEFIEPYSNDHTVYAVFRSAREKGKLPWTCSTQDKQMDESLRGHINIANGTESSAGELKTMRLAQSVTAEYSNYFGATSSAQVNLVLAAINNTLTRTNGCYEKDLALHLNLIANTTNVIYYNPATDPYSPAGIGAGGAWNGELQATLTSVIGDANYDIGHLFGASGGGGNAGCIGCVCNSGKGSGFTSPADAIPQGDNFDIDYVAHEVGHQLGGNHTFSHSIESGGINNVEVGSGITIMGYAGITSRDVAPHSIDIFHERSIQQIQNNLAAKTCPVTTNITANNATPVVSPMGPFTIPISTPFALTGTATDANGDPLTYCWEQNDQANSTVTGANSIAFVTKAVGPNWLSWPATTSPTRTFPILATILAGNFTTGPLPGGDAGTNIEALSSISRNLNFRLTVRDNCPYSSTAPLKVGQTAFTDVQVVVTNSSGPFAVTSPNTNVSWPGGSSQTITWDVNNTTNAPVSCANVKISISTDGGLTFPTVLVASTANDGSEPVTIPSTATTTARIKVEAVGNIFFDISNSNFTISAPTGTFDFTPPAPVSVACAGATSAAISLATVSNGGFSVPINLTATGNPAGTTVSFAPNPVTPGSSTTVTLNGTNTLTPGNYVITVTGTAGAVVRTVQLTYTVNPGTGPAIGTQPAARQVCDGLNTSFTGASATATSLQWQVSTNGGGAWSNLSNAAPYSGVTTGTLTITGATLSMNTYQYRLVANGQCGSTNSSAAVLTVNALPTVGVTASAASVCSGTPVTLTATGADTYAWSSGTVPATGNVVVAAPAVTSTYTVTGTITATGCTNTANVQVIATAKPTVTLKAVPFTRLLPNTSTTLTATGSSATTTNFVYSWTYTGPGAAPVFIGNTHNVNFSGRGTYTVTAADAGNLACVSLPASITIGDSASTRLFIFPSPNDGRFTVSYYSPSVPTQQGITIYDSKGARVYNMQLPVTQGYQYHAIDLRRNGSGIYYIVVRDANGKEITTGRVMVN